MQSKDVAGAGSPAGIVVVAVVLPFGGLVSELMFGLMSTAQAMFPTWWHVVALCAANLVNVALHAGAWSGRSSLPLRAAATGFVVGMSALYALVEAPMLPIIALLSWVGVGVLAAAPYLALGGGVYLIVRLAQSWQEQRLPAAQLAMLLIVTASAPLGIELWNHSVRLDTAATMARLADELQNGSDEDREQRLADALRQGSRSAQRCLCFRSPSEHTPWFDNGPTGHLAMGRQFWFVDDGRELVGVEDARLAFYRTHGESIDDDDVVTPLRWQSSRFEVAAEPYAAIASVSWQLVVHSVSITNGEARFEIEMPPGAVASSLSLWIDGRERPAAFGSEDQVRAAYDQVTAADRDPALLREIGGNRLELLLFPVSSRSDPMRVQIGFTVPMCQRGSEVLLKLPRVSGHNCKPRSSRSHELVIDEGGSRSKRRIDRRELRETLSFAFADRVTWTEDADGIVLQRLSPRPPAPVQDEQIFAVLEASRSVAENLPDPLSLLDALAGGRPMTLFLAHGKRSHRLRGDAKTVAAAVASSLPSFVGGVDAAAALQDAILEARSNGVSRVYWLHGEMQRRLVEEVPHVFGDTMLCSLAVRDGRNVLREHPDIVSGAVEIPSYGSSPEQLVVALREWRRFGGLQSTSFGERQRVFRRPDIVPIKAVRTTDQLARLWAAGEARRLLEVGQREDAAGLAARYRLVTAGVGAVVLESAEQYEAHDLDPGARVGREPAEMLGSQPVPESSTWILLLSGLVVAGLLRVRRSTGA